MEEKKKEENKSTRFVVEEVGAPKTEKKSEEMEVTPVIQNVEAVKEEIKEPEIKKEEVKLEEKKEKPKKESSFNVLWILIPGMLLLGLLIGGIFAYVFGLQKISNPTETLVEETQNVAQPTETPSATPTSSPSADLSKYKVKILNGSGIKGEAGKVQTLLEGAGFTILSTGNATTYDYTKTEVTLKTGVDPDFVTTLVASLSKDYQVSSPKTLSSQTNDVTVTVGSLKVE